MPSALISPGYWRRQECLSAASFSGSSSFTAGTGDCCLGEAEFLAKLPSGDEELPVLGKEEILRKISWLQTPAKYWETYRISVTDVRPAPLPVLF
jgi:hypothetical protein